MSRNFSDIDQLGQSQFGELLTVNRTPIIELNSSYGASLLRDEQTTAGTGSITSSNGEIVLSTGATASSRAFIESAEIGRYIPGYSAELGVGFRLDTLPSGNQEAIWGGLSSDGNDGLYFGYDGTGLFVCRKDSGTENKVYQSSWNIDKLDGTGASGATIDLTDGNIFQVDFTWYGYGQITFGVLAVVNNQQKFIACHQLNGFGETSIKSPNLKVIAEVKNNADASDLTCYLGGRQYSIVGRYNPKYRFTGDFRGSVSTSTTVVPLISFRRKSAFDDRSIKLQSYQILATSSNHYVEIRIGGTLTGASFGTPTDYIAAETALERDKSATAISGGTVVFTGMAPSGTNPAQANLAQSNVDLDIPNGSVVTLCARTITGSGTAVSTFNMREEW